jgi:hypothetical protein
MRTSGIAVLVIVAGLGRWASAEPVDLSKPFQVDKDTICLFHLDEAAGGEVRDAVPRGKSGKVQEPSTAEGKFAGALKYLRQRFHLSRNAVETGGLQNRTRPGAGTLYLPGLLRVDGSCGSRRRRHQGLPV